MKTILPILFLHIFSAFLIGKESSQEVLSPRNASYDINVSLDTGSKILDGIETLYWKNITNTPVHELQFHLYLNAFKNTQSTFMIESGGRHRGFSVDKADSNSWGWIDVTSLKVNGGEELSDSMEFIHPDDNNENDQTVVKIPLESPVLPGEQITVQILFNAKLPQIMARTGFSDNYYLVGQWFPKIGVFEAEGQRGREKAGWNCHQFHSNGEFYADYGVYNVNITLPQNYNVGATGIKVNESIIKDSTKTLTYKAEDVVDFAWTASPLFKFVQDKWKDVDITLLLQPQHIPQANRHIQAAKNAFEFFEENLGKYPYPSMTIVDPPFRGLASAGMEYPMFITAGCLWGIPDGLKLTEMVTIHELGHNFFMGILASNEFEEAWLDEGFNTYFEKRIMDQYYGEKTSGIDILGYHYGDGEKSRLDYTDMWNPYLTIINSYAWQYPYGGYSISSYSKPGVVLATLENLVGTENMNDIMRTYYDQWKFKHPTAQDFYDIVNEKVSTLNDTILGNNMDWYFDQTINTGEVFDYKVVNFYYKSNRSMWGIFDSDSGKTFLTDEENLQPYKYKNIVLVAREGEIKIPTEVLVHFTDGEEITEIYDGNERLKAFEFMRDSKIEWVQIDPKRKIMLDINLANNSLINKYETSVVWKYTAKLIFWAQNSMLTLFL